MRFKGLLLFALVITGSHLQAGVKEGIAAMHKGDYKTAYKEFLPLAEKGDDISMITLGLMHHRGQGVKQDSSKAMDWYIKAFKKKNGDAYSNIGVMFRDGSGVKKNKKMAYCLFLITHVCGLGTESTQYRANRCLRKIIPKMSKDELKECFGYTLEYIRAYVESKGTLEGVPEKYKPSKNRLALKDKPWWVEGELDFLGENNKNSQRNTPSSQAKFKSGSVSFSNHGKNLIYVTRVLCDGKDFSAPVGVLSVGGAKSSAFTFPGSIPNIFTIEYEKDGKKLSSEVSGKEVALAIEQAKKADEITLHFIYSDNGEFIVKLHFDRGGKSFLHEGELWPDEKNPKFRLYKELVRSACKGAPKNVEKLMKDGAPFTWKNDPISLTPLEWSVRWDNKNCFKILMSYLPDDYSIHNYANCIKLAAQESYVDILKKLLENPKSKQIPKDCLEDIFYLTCYHSKTPASLELLLKNYDVGIDYRVRDFGHTLLFVAVQSGKANVVEWLLKNGANKNVSLQNGSKPIDWAKNDEIRNLLKEN